MANGTTRIIPSVTGGALTNATGVILETMLAREAAERQQSQFDAELDLTKRANAINEFVTLAGFSEPGTTLGDLGHIGKTLFRRGWGMDPDGLEDLPLNPKTLQGVIERSGIDRIEAEIAGEVGQEAGTGLLLPSIRAILQLEPDQAVANLRSYEAGMKMNALINISRDPDLMEEHMFRVLGRDPVTLRIPGVDGAPDREITFQSTEMARLYAAFMMAREKFSMELRATEGNEAENLTNEIKEAVLEAKHSISSTVIQGRILPMYQEAAQTGDGSKIRAFLDDPDVTEGEKYAIQFLVGSIGAGEEAFLANLPRELANFWRIGSRLRELMSPEDFMKIMPSVTENLQPGFSAELGKKWWGLGGLEMEFSTGAGSGQPGAAPGAAPAWGDERVGTGGVPGSARLDLSQVPREPLMQVIEESVLAGEVTIEDLPGLGVPEDVINEMFPPPDHSSSRPRGEEVSDERRVAAIPEGGIDPESVPERIRDKTIQYNKGLEAYAALSSPSPFLQRSLDRTRREIEAFTQYNRSSETLTEPVDVSQFSSEVHRAMARRMNTMIRARSRSTNANQVRDLGERIRAMAEELNLAGS